MTFGKLITPWWTAAEKEVGGSVLPPPAFSLQAQVLSLLALEKGDDEENR